MKYLRAIGNFLKSLFTSTPFVEEPKKLEQEQPSLPGLEKPVEVPATIKPPWKSKAETFIGKEETDSKFNKFLSKYWPKTGLNYKTIIGTSFAWCGLFAAMLFSETGYEYISNGAGARNWAKNGQEIVWYQNGIPEGAIIHLNHGFDCNSSKNNHVTLANGACAIQDIIETKKDAKGVYQPVLVNGKPVLKSGATFDGLGGNQNNAVRISTYPVKEICAVRWPKYQIIDKVKIPVPLPGKVTKSLKCTTNGKGGQTTR
jgi:hypothetical protein